MKYLLILFTSFCFGQFNPIFFASTSRIANLIPKSQDFDDVVWDKGQTTVTPNTTTAPDGTSTADKLVENVTGATLHWVRTPISVISGRNYTFSVHAKLADIRYIRLLDDVQNKDIKVNLSSGAVISATVPSYNVQTLASGWFRISFLYQPLVSGSVNFFIELITTAGAISYAGNGTSGIYIWGAQLNLGSSASPYVPNL